MHPIIHKLSLITTDLKNRGLSESVIRLGLKEYLQDIILFAIYNDQDLKNLIFYGGTCLRKLYQLNRFSEDLDFESSKPIDLKLAAAKVIHHFKEDKFSGVSVSVQKSKDTSRVIFKFPILNTLGLSPLEEERLHVKVEINDQPTGKYSTELVPYVKDHYSMLIKHYDLPTLMAGKMVACLTRVFEKGKTGVEIKGRDYYDLVWYLQKQVTPNIKKLKDADKKYTLEKAWELLDQKAELISSRDLLVDLEPLFDNQVFIRDWCNNFHQIYKRLRGQ